MAYTFSTDQQSIIDARDQNILVSAAAGSGKTSVLTERIVGLVKGTKEKPGIDIDRILVVTFTNAAAKEMKERIGNRLLELIAANPDDAHLQKQSTLVHSAQITTIDSFCLYLVRNNFHKINLDPAFRIVGEGEKKLIKEDVLKDVIKRAYASGDEDFYHIVDCYSKKDNDDSLEKNILKLFEYAMSYPWPLKWLEDRRGDYVYSSVEEFENSNLVTNVKKETVALLKGVATNIKKGIPLCLVPGGPYTYEETFNDDIAFIEGIIERAQDASFDELSNLLAADFGKLKNVNKDCEEALKKVAQDYRDAYKKEYKKIRDKFFEYSLLEYYQDMTDSARVVNKLLDLVIDFSQSFEKEKRDRGIIDFSDMEHMAVSILIKNYNDDGSYDITDVAEGYRDHFEEVMVDEYQDSNMVQELLIQSVSRELSGSGHNRFMVGDVKQSIYKFRLARPEIFTKKTFTYEKAPDAPDRLITLKQNYRSRKSVIDSVNAVFKDIMKEDLGGIEYDEDAMLYPGAKYNADSAFNRTEVVLLETDSSAEKKREIEAEAIALKIKELVGSAILYDVKNEKDYVASYRDVTVLFRATRTWNGDIKAAFEKHGIPYHIEGVGAFYDTTEIREVISFLKVLNNPLDDIALYAAMTSLFGKMTDEDCALIKGLSGGKERFFFDKVKAYAGSHPEDKKVTDFLSLVSRYRKLATVVPIHELIERLFDETGYRFLVAALPFGKQRLANVEMLILKASEYAKTSFYGLFHFLRYIELIKKMEEDEGEANTFDENADVVRVMSIHKSKGLEFPICIIGGIETSFNERDLNDNIVNDIDDGVGVAYIDPDKRIKRNTLMKNYLIEKTRRENIGEEIRILYVAMTRAKEKLIMFGADKDAQGWIERGITKGVAKSYMSLVQNSVVNNMDSLFDCRVITEADVLAVTVSNDLASKVLRDELEAGAGNASEDIVKRLEERFSFEYPHANLARLYTKTTVSELKMAEIERHVEEDGAHKPFEENESRETIPAFAGQEAEVKGTDRGTAYHNVLQMLEFKAFAEIAGDDSKLMAELKTQIEAIVASGKMTKEDTDKVNRSKLITFLKSEVAKRMMEADAKDRLYKEQPFVIGVPASEVEEGFPEDETVLVQGVIDVYFIEDGIVSVLDYKTDRVDSGEELIERYRKQLWYYTKAVEQLTGLKADSPIIYSFGLNDTFVVK